MKDDIIPLAKTFISIPSISGDMPHTEKLLEQIRSFLSDFHPRVFSSNKYPSLLFSNTNESENNFKLIFNAHIDVVPGKKEQFIPIENNGRLYGRGAYDMKTAAAVMVILFKEFSKKVSFPLALQIVTEEETGGQDGTQHQIKQGIRGEFVIIGEGTGLRIIHKAKARMVMKLIAKGLTSHSAYPWLGDNAIWNMHQALQKLIAFYPIPKEESGATTVTIARIETTNDVYNKIPHDCIAYLDIRFTPEEKETIVATIESLLPTGITSELIFKFTPHETDKDNPYIAIMQKQSTQLLAQPLQLGMAHGTSDAAFYTEVGCDGIEFGPIGGNHHSDGEWVDIKSLFTYYKLLKQLLLSMGSC